MSSPSTSLSLGAAIIININIMLGIGVFINSVELAKRAGAAGFLGYTAIGFLMLPLIISIATLLRRYPAGGFYTFGAHGLHPFAGYISGWAYFVGKLASAALMVHTAVTTFCALIGHTPSSIMLIDIIIIGIFSALNMGNLKIGSTIQRIFVACKLFPLALLGLLSWFLLKAHTLSAPSFVISGLPSTLPLVLYATVGFEAACSISSKIKDPEKNAPRAVLISYALVIGITSLFQYLLYGIIGDTLRTMNSYTEPFAHIMLTLLPMHGTCNQLILQLLYTGITLSALGGAYGILFSNSWNLYTLASHGHLPYSSFFLQHNRWQIPWAAVALEGSIAALYVIISSGRQVVLQQISALGCIVAYTISALALIAYNRKNKLPAQQSIIPVLGLVNCIMLAASCSYSLYLSSLQGLIWFGSLVALGAALYTKPTSITHQKTAANN